MTPQEYQNNFKKELLELLQKYNAAIELQQFDSLYMPEQAMVIEFEFDESLFKENQTGTIPSLFLGSHFG